MDFDDATLSQLDILVAAQLSMEPHFCFEFTSLALLALSVTWTWRWDGSYRVTWSSGFLLHIDE